MNSAAQALEAPKRIALALSGGGFRATLFHLGAVIALRDAGLLSRVTHISSVSGGAILAAHLVNHWDAYAKPGWDSGPFLTATKKLLALTRFDVVGRIVRRCYGSTKLLSWYYKRRLFGRTTLGDLSGKGNCPVLYLMATDLTTGGPCCFTTTEGGKWLRDARSDATTACAADTLPIAFAVACSSAFPLFFREMRLTPKVLHVTEKELGRAEYFLTDGGVYDNSGLTAFENLWKRPREKPDLVLASDARRVFEWSAAGKEKSLGFFTRPLSLQRAYEICSNRAETLAETHYPSEFLYLRLTKDAPSELSGAARRCLRELRTDLNRFSCAECSALLRHGYAAAKATLMERGWWSTPDQLSPDWSRLGVQDIPEDLDKHLQNSDRLVGPLRRFFFYRDYVSYLMLIVLLVMGAVLTKIYWWDSRTRIPELRTAWSVVDDGAIGDDPIKSKLDDAGYREIRQSLTREAYAYKDKEKIDEPVVSYRVQSPRFLHRVPTFAVCADKGLGAYELRTRALLWLEYGEFSFPQRVKVERSSQGELKLEIPGAPEGTSIILLAAVVPKASGIESSDAAPLLSKWRLCE